MDNGQKTKDKRQKTKDNRQKTKDNRQKTKDKRQKTKDKRQKTKDKEKVTRKEGRKEARTRVPRVEKPRYWVLKQSHSKLCSVPDIDRVNIEAVSTARRGPKRSTMGQRPRNKTKEHHGPWFKIIHNGGPVWYVFRQLIRLKRKSSKLSPSPKFGVCQLLGVKAC